MSIEQSILDNIGEFSTEKSSQTESALIALEDRLKILFPDLSTRQRLVAWITEEEKTGAFQALEHEPTGFKKAYVSSKQPEIVVKHFFLGIADGDSWQQEAKNEQRARMALGDEFFPETQYVVIHNSTFADSQTPENQYFVLQDRLYGVHLKEFTSRILDLLYSQMSDEEVDEYFSENPQQWSVLKGKALQHFLPKDLWESARQEAQELAAKLSVLQRRYVLSDLDFFITPEGKIKIIDLQLDPVDEYEPNEEGFPEGLEDLQLIFGIQDE